MTTPFTKSARCGQFIFPLNEVAARLVDAYPGHLARKWHRNNASSYRINRQVALQKLRIKNNRFPQFAYRIISLKIL